MVTASQLQILQSPITGLISSVSSSVLVKLDDSNYLQWHFQMQLLLEGYGIMGFVDGSTCCPSQFSSISSSDSEASSMGVGSRIESDDYKAWKMHDYALMLLLTATLSSSAISYVIGSTSSREMWVCLQNHFFLPRTKTSIIKLQTYLYNMKKGSDLISQFLRRIKDARDGLSILGVTLADEDFVLIALNGLPTTYNTFKCVIRGREGVISLENFRQQLLAEEAIVDCASVTKFGDCQTQGSFFPLSSSQLHARFNDGYHAQYNFSSCQSRLGNNVDGYNGVYRNFRFKSRGKGRFHYNNGAIYKSFPDCSPGILGSPPSPYFNSPPPDFPTHQICSQKDHFDDDCYPRHNAQSSVSTPESCQSTLDQQFKLGCPVILQKHETPLQSNSDVEIHRVYDCKSGSLSDFIVSEDEMFLDDAKDQVFECIDNEGTKSQLISMGLQPCIQVTFPVLNSDNKTAISVPAQIVALAHEFRRFYVFQLCNGGRIFDIQLGYHMRICDKGGGTKSTLIWQKETLVLIWQKESLVLIWLLW
ncbi:hypothetical protein COP2_034965 [Malus domestica]